MNKKLIVGGILAAGALYYITTQKSDDTDGFGGGGGMGILPSESIIPTGGDTIYNLPGLPKMSNPWDGGAGPITPKLPEATKTGGAFGMGIDPGVGEAILKKDAVPKTKADDFKNFVRMSPADQGKTTGSTLWDFGKKGTEIQYGIKAKSYDFVGGLFGFDLGLERGLKKDKEENTFSRKTSQKDTQNIISDMLKSSGHDVSTMQRIKSSSRKTLPGRVSVESYFSGTSQGRSYAKKLYGTKKGRYKDGRGGTTSSPGSPD